MFSFTLIVSLMMFCVRFLSELMILLSTHHLTTHRTCPNKVQSMSCEFDLKNMKMQCRKYQKMQFCNYIFILGKLFFLHNLIHIDLKKRTLLASFFIGTIIKLMIFFVLQVCLFFLRKNSKELDVY